MKRFAFCVALALAGTIWAGEEKAEQSLRLELELVDGSRIIGVPGIESVPVQTSYAKMDVPLKQILVLKMGEDHETAAVDLQNGDKVKGVVNLEPIKLETVFGKVSIGVGHIRELRVVLSGGELMRGLILHYSFDKDEDGKVIDKSGRGNDGTWVGAPMYEAGIQGKAARFRSKDTYIVSASERLNMNGWRETTVSLWVSLAGYTTYGHVINRGPLTTEQAGAFELALGPTYGSGVVALRSGPTKTAAEKQGGGTSLALNRWYHLTLTYDGVKMCYYIDGNLEKEAAAGERNTPIWDCADSRLVIGNMSRIPFINWLDMFFNGRVDEVHIFNRALSGDEVKRLSDVHK